MNFFGKIRSLIMRIFPIKPTIKALNLQVQDMADIPELQGLWGSLYNGTPPFLKGKQKYLNIPRIVSFDVARLAVGEAKFSSNDKNADFILQTLIAPNLQQAVEQTVAMGSCAWRLWVDRSGKPHIDLYQCEDILPVDIEDNKVVGLVFVDRKVVHPTDYTTMTYTRLEYQKYDSASRMMHVVVKAYRKQGEPAPDDLGGEIPLASVPEWEDITPEWSISNCDAPTFVYIASPWHIAGSNNLAIGASIYADGVDQIEELQERRNQLDWEYDSGKRKLMVDEASLPTDQFGNVTIDPADRELYRKLSGSMSANNSIKDQFADFSPTIRYQEYHTDIKRILNELAKVCHMSNGYLSFDELNGAVTAQEIRSRDKDSYATVCNVQNKTARPAVLATLHGFSILLTALGNPLRYDYETATNDDNFSIVWGDGIMDDPDAERDVAQSEVQSGLMSKRWYLIHFRGLTEQEADEELALIKSDSPVVDTSFFGG